MAMPKKYYKVPESATMSDDKKSFTIEWNGDTCTYTKDEKQGCWVKAANEDADAGTTTAGDIADVPMPLGNQKKPKKKKVVKETATAGSTNTADFSNDFGTDTPRLPSELGDLTGKKSIGMWGGYNDYNMTIIDPFTGKKYELLRILNNQGKKCPGSSTTNPPVSRSPYDEYVKGGKFILNKPGNYSPAKKHEMNTRAQHKKLKDILQKAFFDNMYGKKSSAEKVEKKISIATKAVNKVVDKDDE